MSGEDVIVVGAGIAGLAAAQALQRAGRHVQVFEASERPGGRIVRFTHKGDAAEVGAQGYHSNYREALALVDRMGLTKDLAPAGGAVRFLDKEGRPRESASNADLMRILGPRGTVDLARFWTQYFGFSKLKDQFSISEHIAEYDNKTAAEALSWAGPAFRDFVLRPMAHGWTAARPEDTSMHYLVSVLKLRLTTKVFGLRTGNVTLCERLAQSVPVKYATEVTSLLVSSDRRVQGVVLSDGRAVKASHVILACTVGAAAKIIPTEWGAAKQFLSEFNFSPIPIAVFFLDRPLPDGPALYMGHPFRDATYNMAINHAHRTPFLVPSGKAVISAWPAFPGSADLVTMPEQAVFERALNDMEAFIPGITNWVEEARLMRHSWGFARYHPGDIRKVLDFKEYARDLRGVSFAGNDYDGVMMECAVRSGLRAADRAMAA